MDILAATDTSILTSCWERTLDMCATTEKLEAEAFVLECQKLAYNWRTPSKLSFKRGLFQSDISISSATDLRPFWPNVRMVLSIHMPLVIKNWKRRHLITKLPKYQWNNWRSFYIHFVNISLKTGNFQPNITIFSATEIFLWGSFAWMGLSMRMLRLKNWKRRHLTWIVKISKNQSA